MERVEKPKKKKTSPQTSISLDRVRWQLAKLWLGLAIPIFLILIGQSMFGKYQTKVQAVWSWALPTLMPTLALIITVLGANAIGAAEDGKRRVKRSFYIIAFGLSALYLLLILITLLIEPFTPFEALELLNLSSLWLGPFQGLVASALAILFFTKQAEENRAPRS
jgi:hypothetical protein